MTDIVEVLSLKLTTAKSQVERHVLCRARDEIIKLRERICDLDQVRDYTASDIEQYQLPWTS